MRPTFAHGHKSRIYRYYVSETLLPIGKSSNSHNRTGERLSATRLERVLANSLLPILPVGADAESVFTAITRVRLQKAHMRIKLDLFAVMAEDEIEADMLIRAQAIDAQAQISGDILTMTIPNQAIRRGKTIAATNILDDAERRKLLAEQLRKSHDLLKRLNASPLEPEHHHQMSVPNNEWSRQRIAIGLLAPDIQKLLLSGKAPTQLTPDMLIGRDLPMDWEEQRRVFGIG
jgi:site-specific DNA recombinase